MLAPWPAAGTAKALLELLAGPPDTALARGLLLGILDPADELVARQGGDVLPGIERRVSRGESHHMLPRRCHRIGGAMHLIDRQTVYNWSIQ